MGSSASVVSQVAEQVQDAVETIQEQQQAAPAAAPQCQPGEVATGKLMAENAHMKIGVSASCCNV
jgi:hypothetical protein